MSIAQNGTQYKAPFKNEDIRERFLDTAAGEDVSVEEVLRWACMHISQIRTQFSDDDKLWTAEDVLDMLTLAIVKLRRKHPNLGLVEALPDTRGVLDRLRYYEDVL